MFQKFREKHETLAQAILFMLLSLVATGVDFLVFNLLNGWLFVPLSDRAFSWWIVSYPVASGGLAAFLATVCAYFCSQVVNFFIHRKATFQATNNPVGSAVLYLIMIVITWFVQILMGGVFLGWFAPAVGIFWAGNLSRFANNFLTMLIQFPLNKFVIMRKRKGE